MRYSTKIKWSFASGIIAAVCWIIGDMSVVGFEVNPNDYPLFSQTYSDKVDVDFAVLMLEGSTERLMFGALIAAMTASLYLPGIWLAFQYFKDQSKWYAWGTYFILVVSVVLSPLGHAAFFYMGEIYKAIYHTDKAAHLYLLNTASAFMKVLYISWGTAIIVMLTGWLIFSSLVFMGKTKLPGWAGFISPVFLTLYQLPFKFILPPSQLKGWLVSAGFNISYLVFFLLLLVLFRKKLAMNQE